MTYRPSTRLYYRYDELVRSRVEAVTPTAEEGRSVYREGEKFIAKNERGKRVEESTFQRDYLGDSFDREVASIVIYR